MNVHCRYTYRIDVYGTTALPLVGTLVEWKENTYHVTGVYKDKTGRHFFRMQEYEENDEGSPLSVHVVYSRGNWYIRDELQKICIPKRDLNTPMEDEWGTGIY